MEIDPVCGMEVDPKTTLWKTDFDGRTYYFCSKGCMEDFEKEPHKYLESDEHRGEHMHDH